MDPSDIIPKIKKATKQAHDIANVAREKKPQTEEIAQQAEEIVHPLEIAPLIKDDILHKAEDAKKEADKADDHAKHADKLADEAEEALKEEEPDKDKLLPALEKALDALAEAKKADKDAEKAKKKAKEALHEANDVHKPEDHPEHAEHPEHPEDAEHAKHPEHIDPQKVVDDAKKLADDLEDHAKKGEPDVEKARTFVLPPEVAPEVGKDLVDHANEADKLAHDVAHIADDLKHRADEIQPVLDEAKEHPEDAALQKKAEDLAKELDKLAKDADKVGDKADSAAQDLDTDLDNLLPIFTPEDFPPEPRAELETPLQESHEEVHEHPADDTFPCPFCTNAKWNWPEIFREGFGISDEQMEKMTEEERCDKKLEALRKAITKLQEVAGLLENQKLTFQGTP